MNWNLRYSNEQEQTYQHPVTGSGLCGKKGGCTDCGKILPAVQKAQTMPLHVEGESHESFMGRTNGMVDAFGGLNAHLCNRNNGDANISHSHVQHIAGMGDLNMGRIKQAQGLATAMGGAQNVPSSVQKAQNTTYLSEAPKQMQGYSDGSGGTGSFESVPWLNQNTGTLNPISSGDSSDDNDDVTSPDVY